MAELLRAEGLSRYYGYRKAIDKLDLSVQEGELVLLLGPNGAGKSTLLAALLSRGEPDEGAIYFQNQKISRNEERRHYLSFVSFLGHDPGLYYDMTAYENLAFFLGLYYKQDKALEEVILAGLATAGLLQRRSDNVRGFSRGMKQRLALLRTFLVPSRLVLLDEPLTGLDKGGERFLLGLIRDFKAKGGSLLVVTHGEKQFEDLTDRFVFIQDGHIVADIDQARFTAKARDKVHSMLFGE